MPISSVPPPDRRGRTLSEADSKRMLGRFGVPFAPERMVLDAASAVVAADAIGYPVVAKLCGDAIAQSLLHVHTHMQPHYLLSQVAAIKSRKPSNAT